MKKITFLLLLALLVFHTSAQTVNCNLTLITTIEGYNVYRHSPSGAIIYKAKMYIDADGSPRAYGPNNTGLDYTANAGSPGNWWGIVTDANGDPVIQGSGDPYPGMYVSTTSLANSAYSSTNPSRYTNSETVPFFVLPSALVSLGAIHIGDMGYVYNTATGLGCYAIYADSGPAGKLGEGSMYLADQIGINSNPKTGGTSSAIIDYIVFPQSGYGQGTIPTLSQINTIGTTQINSIGGIGIVSCIDNPINNPLNLSVTQTACPLNNVQFSWSNTGSNWHIDISTSSSFTNYWLKYVSNATTYTGPAGFVDHTDGITPLALQAGITYYWRVVNSNGSFSGPSFIFNGCDVTVPTTLVNFPGNWQTQNFTANFTDADNVGGSGLEKSYYQVLEYNGTEWGANYNNGFLADNFDSYNSTLWTVPASTGTWNVTSGNLIQTDTVITNSNIYAPLNQNLSNRYMYQFYVKIDAATYAANQHRFGFHFFSDNAALTNRNNSYFIFFRQETSKLEFYKVVNDVFTLANTVDNVTTTFGQWYDIKVIFDRTTGKIDVYRDNILLGTWTDTAVLTNQGNYISFRTGNCKAYISEIKVYRSRNASASISVGSAATNDIRVQNPNPTTFAAKIKSIVNDVVGNLSAIAYTDLNIDWTAPSAVSIFDGIGTDIDTTNSLTSLNANWTASTDPHSGVVKYYYAVGTSAGGTNIVNWSDNNLSTNAAIIGLTLVNGQTYFVSVKSENGAGLQSSVSSSNGIYVALAPLAAFSYNPVTICVGTSVNFINQSQNATSYQWTINGGIPASSSLENLAALFSTPGTYDILLTSIGNGISNTNTQQVIVRPNANADFYASSTNYILPNAFVVFTNNSNNSSGYHWDFGNGNSTTDANPWNSYSTTGDYTVSLIAYNSQCANDTLEMVNYIHVDAAVGIEEQELKNQILLIPNPFSTSSELIFYSEQIEDVKIYVIDALGKIINIYEGKSVIGRNAYSLNTKALSLNQGIYQIIVEKNNIKSLTKAIVY